MTAPAPALAAHRPHIGFGHVWHTRLRPRRHRFIVPTFFLLLPMRTLRAHPEAAGVLALNRPGALAFRDADHGDGRSPALYHKPLEGITATLPLSALKPLVLQWRSTHSSL